MDNHNQIVVNYTRLPSLDHTVQPCFHLNNNLIIITFVIMYGHGQNTETLVAVHGKNGRNLYLVNGNRRVYILTVMYQSYPFNIDGKYKEMLLFDPSLFFNSKISFFIGGNSPSYFQHGNRLCVFLRYVSPLLHYYVTTFT